MPSPHSSWSRPGAGRDPGDIAADVEARDVRDLLATALRNPHPRLFRMLDRLGPRALKMGVYRRLNDTLHGPAAAALLDDVELNDAVLRIAEQVAEDPVLLAARRAIGSSSADLTS